MGTVISLKEVTDALQMLFDEVDNYLDPTTGEIFSVGQDERRALEEDDEPDPDDEPDGEPDEMDKLREAYDQDRLIKLPDAYDVNEWSIMEEFSLEHRSEKIRRELYNALHGRGAFRAFKDAVRRLNIQEDWYRFRDKALEDIAREWLEEHNLTYK